MKHIELNNNKKVFFASDFHLGAPNPKESRTREYKVIEWLNYVQKDAQVIFLVGDIFDFWFEYKKVVPKGFVRIQAKIAELVEKGIEDYFFLGNHDMWMKNYFSEELGVKMVENELEVKINNKTFYISHGDGLGPGDYGYKFIKKIFRNRVCQFLFSLLHPSMGLSLANYFSKRSRASSGIEDQSFTKKENEWLYQFCIEKLKTEDIDFFVFGHRHLPMEISINSSKYFNLGEWMNYQTFAEFDGEDQKLFSWRNGKIEIFKGIQL